MAKKEEEQGKLTRWGGNRVRMKYDRKDLKTVAVKLKEDGGKEPKAGMHGDAGKL